MTHELLTLSEGPDFNAFTLPLLILALALAAFTLWSNFRSSQRPLLSRETLRPIILRLGVIGTFAFFLLSSAISDLSTWPLMLITHAAVCWLFLFASYGLVFEAVCRVGAIFGVRLWTRYVSVNLVLAWLVGSRVVTLFVMLMGPLGFRLSLAILSAALLIYAALFVGKPYAVQTQTSEPSEKPSRSALAVSARWWDHAGYYGLLLFLAAATIGLIYINFYRPIGLWDAYTHWLTLPHEVLVNDRMVGFYEITRSVAPAYAPQQIVDTAMLLWFWGDLSGSDHLLQALSPLCYALGIWVILDISRTYGGVFLQAAILIIAALIFINLPVSYRVSVYSDMRGALCILIACLAFVLAAPDKDGDSAPRLSTGAIVFMALIASTIFSFKPYAWPLAFVPLATMVISGYPWRQWLLFGGFVFLAAIIEIVPIQILAPDVQIFEIGSVSSRLADTIRTAFVPNLETLTLEFGARAGTLETFIGFVALGVLGFGAGFLSKDKRLALTLKTSGLMILGLSFLLLVALNSGVGFGNSLTRYQTNLVLAVILTLALCLRLINFGWRALRLSLLIACVAGYAFYLTYPKSPLAIETAWYKQRLANLTIFQEPVFPDNGLIRQTLETEANGIDVRVLSNTHKKNLDQYQLNYLLARTSRRSISVSDPIMLPIQRINQATTYEELQETLARMRPTHFFFVEPQPILGTVIPEGFHTTAEVLEMIATS